MKEASEKGTPVIRPLFYDFSSDTSAWEIEDQYMFGPDVMVAPIMNKGEVKRDVYLPKGTSWKNAWTGESFNGGSVVSVDAPIDTIPVFIRGGSEITF